MDADRDLIEAACFAHDLGHPPYGHGGEKALYAEMRNCGGFEGNGQTLRIISRLEKYQARGQGINPHPQTCAGDPQVSNTVWSIRYRALPKGTPKCYFDDEQDVVEWAFEGFSSDDCNLLREKDDKGKAKHKSLDCTMMDLADDIAYGIHDIEDIVARKLTDRDKIQKAIEDAFTKVGGSIENDSFDAKKVYCALFGDSFARKQIVSALVNLFVTQIVSVPEFQHALLTHRVDLPAEHRMLLKALKYSSFELIIRQAKLQQLEQRGQRIAAEIFRAMLNDPPALIPEESWAGMEDDACVARRVCDYVAGMTDSYAEKVYRRMFIPGFWQ